MARCCSLNRAVLACSKADTLETRTLVRHDGLHVAEVHVDLALGVDEVTDTFCLFGTLSAIPNASDIVVRSVAIEIGRWLGIVMSVSTQLRVPRHPRPLACGDGDPRSGRGE